MEIHLTENRKTILIKLHFWIEKKIMYLTQKDSKLGTFIKYTFYKKIKSLLRVKMLLIAKGTLREKKKENHSRASNNSVGKLQHYLFFEHSPTNFYFTTLILYIHLLGPGLLYYLITVIVIRPGEAITLLVFIEL